MGQWKLPQRLLAILLVFVLGLSLVSCGAPQGGTPSGSNPLKSRFIKLTEVAPPAVIRELGQAMEGYQPQVKILSPRPDEVLQETEVAVRFQVKDLPLFQDKTLELGPHLHLIVDNQPYQAVYDADQPFILKDLEPGTHTLRVFASRPWYESFKNEGAYAQTTFHIFAKTLTNRVELNQPLLTYSRPKGSYGAEPIMLDFYLANAPLHLIANEDAEDDISDWQVRCTINGESFLIDRWEPIYLKGLKPGKHWVQLELLNEKGEPYPNAFNNTVRLIDYQPGGSDTLSQIIRGELSVAEVLSIVDPNYVYVPELPPEPEVTEPEVTEPELSPEPIEPAPQPELAKPEPAVAPPIEPGLETPSETAEEPAETAKESPAPEALPNPVSEPTLEPISPSAPIPAPEVLPPEILAPAAAESAEPKFFSDETAQPANLEPVVAPSPIVPVWKGLEASEISGNSVEKDQLPGNVKALLKGRDPEARFQSDAVELTPGVVEEPALEAISDESEPLETVPALAPPLTPIPPAPVPNLPEAKPPLLRQWRDRLKQFVPLPEPDASGESKPSFLKGIGDRTKGWFSGSESAPSPSADDPTLKLPQIMDVPSDEQLNMPIAEP